MPEYGIAMTVALSRIMDSGTKFGPVVEARFAHSAPDHAREYEPILGVHDGQRARAYPLWYLDTHEIVNDMLGDVPIAATW